MKNEKIKTLAEFLEVEEEEIQKVSYNENLFEAGNQEYLVLTEWEKEEELKEEITESLWAFNANFILDHTDINWNERTEKAIRKMQEELCEDANEIIKAMITNLDRFIDDAVSEDGAGHFLNRYDGSEEELNGFYIYRTN
ncbi:MAG: hypothetical protein GX964_11135 [Syntrophomonadaceae bacterium]|nr:hypothetical protein [Syntrophomonadaceae bacterium]